VVSNVLQAALSLTIFVSPTVVDGAVKLNDEPCVVAVEVGDKGINDVLPAELHTRETAAAEQLP
jgi:hypothetical protein